jgi:serine/threonine-protein kinase HipA
MNCLLCYKPLTENEIDYHAKCVKKILGLPRMPLIDIDEKKLVSYARKLIGAKTAITGVQPKLSLWLEPTSKNIRFTILDSKSNYIIKPQSGTYTSLPENEDLCMHLATVFGIQTATHGLVRMPTGKLAYLTKRFDRADRTKLACEDLCQLTETLTEHKYRGTYETAGETIKKFSSRPGLDALNFFQLVVFSFITGNADMHLKNFSLLENADGLFILSPAYDLVSTMLVINDEKEEMALNVNGRKRNLHKKGFDRLAESIGLPAKSVQKFYQKLAGKKGEAMWWMDNSFLPSGHKEKLKQLLTERINLFKL